MKKQLGLFEVKIVILVEASEFQERQQEATDNQKYFKDWYQIEKSPNFLWTIFNNTLDDSKAHKEDCYGHKDPKQNILALLRLDDYRSSLFLIFLMISLIFLLIFTEAFKLKANFDRRCQEVIY